VRRLEKFTPYLQEFVPDLKEFIWVYSMNSAIYNFFFSKALVSAPKSVFR